MNTFILKKMRKRDRLSKLSHRRSDYLKLRNEITSDCRKAEKDYIKAKISANLNNTKEHWKILNQIMGKSNNRNDIPSTFMHQNKWTENCKDSAMSINNYFSTIGLSTNLSVGSSRQTAREFFEKFRERATEVIDEEDFTDENVIEACRQLNAKKSCDALKLSEIYQLLF